MKKIVPLLLSIFLIFACKDSPMVSSGQSASGKLNQVMVIMNKHLWTSEIGDTIKAWFSQEQDGLPQVEPIFDLVNLPVDRFDKEIKRHRNVLFVNISSDVDSTSIRYVDSPYARTQKLIEINAPNRDSFIKLFNENKMRIIAIYSKAEQDRLITAYRNTTDSKIYKLLKEKYNIYMNVPTGYYVNKDTLGFVWISSETAQNSKGIVVFTKKYISEAQFNDVVLVEDINEMLKQFIPGPIKGSYMAIDTEIPYSPIYYQYNGHYALKLRGLWTVINDFMAGPMIVNAVLDEKESRIIYTMGYVYYPSELKRNLVKQVDAILSTLKIVDKDSEAER